MKKYIRYSFVLAIGAVVFSGCKKFLNINKDPNDPLTVPEVVIVPPVEINIGTNVTGGFPATTVNYWMQQLSLNQALPTVEIYFIQPADVNNTWTFTVYPNILENLKVMIQEAEPAGHTQYAAIGFALSAYSLAIATDLWGDVPWSQALQMPAITQPKYDPQQSIYGDVQTLLDSALYYAGQPGSAIAPSTDDYIYGGDMTAWTKWIHMMKARYYLRLSNAPGRTAATQADSALTELAQGFGSNSDNAMVPYPGGVGSPWYENTDNAAGGVVLAQYFINLVQGNNDPRLPILAAPASAGADSGLYVGRPSGTATPYNNPYQFSIVNTAYAGVDAPLYLATYSEQLFIQAEATFITQGAAAADPIYRAAIKADMDMLGVASADENTYLATTSRPTLTANTALQSIITEKYVADFLGLEPYNDWRRTGYPVLSVVPNAYVPYIPRRWPYPTNELLANPQPQDSATLASPVWWDTEK
jgi:Starch-binding associating with outer membrane